MAKRKSNTKKPVSRLSLIKGALGKAKRHIERKGIDWDPEMEKPERPRASDIETMGEANSYNRKWNSWVKRVNNYAKAWDEYLAERKRARASISAGKKRR